MNYDIWLKNQITKARNQDKYKQLKHYIKNINDYMGSDLEDRVITNMLLASHFYDKEHYTNTNKILEYYLRRHNK